MSYELFQSGPEYYIPVILISLIVTLIKYSIFPLILAGWRKKPITKKKYLLFCYGINLAIMFLFLAITESSSMTPCLLWTWVFSSVGIKILRRKGRLDGGSCSSSCYDSIHEKPGDLSPEKVNLTRMSLSAKDESAEVLTVASDSLAYMRLSAQDESQPMCGGSEHQAHSKDATFKAHTEYEDPELVQPTTQSREKSIQLSMASDEPRVKYCSRCGAVVDSVTKKCTGCGKKCFKGIPRKLAVSIIINCLLLFVVALTVNTMSDNQEKITELETSKDALWKKNAAYQNDIYELESEIFDLKDEIYELKNELTNMKKKIRFFDSHVVFVEEDGTDWYHIYDCSRLTFEYFWAFNMEYAEYMGYYPCPYCCS